MTTIETEVLEAAAVLKTAVDKAIAAGYRISWPLNAADADRISVSDTAKTLGEPKPLFPMAEENVETVDPFENQKS